jgi:hypothetical protein
VACPAKLADYAYAGVPVIAVVPSWSSLAAIGLDHPDLLAVITTQDPKALETILTQYVPPDTTTRQRYRQAALTVLGLENNARHLRAALGV